jgi:hypothetical protein
VAADLGEHALLQRQLLGNVLLDEIRTLRHHRKIGGKGQLALGRQRRESQAREGGFGIRDRAADPLLHLRLDVRGNDVDPEMQCARGPSAADHAGAEQPQCLYLSHDCHPRKRHDLCNVTSII